MSEQDEKVSCFVSHKRVDSQRVHAWAGPAETIRCYRIKSTGVWTMWKERVQTEAAQRNSFDTHSHGTRRKALGYSDTWWSTGNWKHAKQNLLF